MNKFCPKCGCMTTTVSLNYMIKTDFPNFGEVCLNSLCGWRNYFVKTYTQSNASSPIYGKVEEIGWE